jgi:DNA-binding MarR family transcriptional regulator
MNAKRLADHLEQVGLVRSRPDLSYHRRRDLVPTAEGLRLAKQVAERAMVWERRLSRLVGEPELAQLRLLLEHLEDVLAAERRTTGLRLEAEPRTTSKEKGL